MKPEQTEYPKGEEKEEERPLPPSCPSYACLNPAFPSTQPTDEQLSYRAPPPSDPVLLVFPYPTPPKSIFEISVVEILTRQQSLLLLCPSFLLRVVDAVRGEECVRQSIR